MSKGMIKNHTIPAGATPTHTLHAVKLNFGVHPYHHLCIIGLYCTDLLSG
jgi:hypothetical protein